MVSKKVGWFTVGGYAAAAMAAPFADAKALKAVNDFGKGATFTISAVASTSSQVMQVANLTPGGKSWDATPWWEIEEAERPVRNLPWPKKD